MYHVTHGRKGKSIDGRGRAHLSWQRSRRWASSFPPVEHWHQSGCGQIKTVANLHPAKQHHSFDPERTTSPSFEKDQNTWIATVTICGWSMQLLVYWCTSRPLAGVVYNISAQQRAKLKFGNPNPPSIPWPPQKNGDQAFNRIQAPPPNKTHFCRRISDSSLSTFRFCSTIRTCIWWQQEEPMSILSKNIHSQNAMLGVVSWSCPSYQNLLHLLWVTHHLGEGRE